MSKNTFSPFDYPTVEKLFRELLEKLTEESGRGAILISTSNVEDFLTTLIEDVLPSKEKSYKSILLNYPGPLSSFSSKIELAYAFRLINKNLYDSLNALRKIRNDAAHSSSTFSLREMSDKVKMIYDLGPNFPIYVRKTAMKMMMSLKVEDMKTVLNESDLPEEEKRGILEETFGDQKVIDSLKEQLPHWELVVGISFICGLLEKQREEIGAILQGIDTWISMVTKST